MLDELAMLERLNHGYFRAFAAAAKTLNFTSAARQAAMTQSGVSQHIAKLEKQLGTKLFTRSKKGVALTKAGELLLTFIESQKSETSALIDKIQGAIDCRKGKVRYAMPYSCLLTPHFALLLDRRARFSENDLEVGLHSSAVILQQLLDHKIDFGFVSVRPDDKRFSFTLACREEYILAGRDEASSVGKKFLLESDFVSYPGMENLYGIWSSHHFGVRALPYSSLHISGSVNSLQGAVIMAEGGLGISVFPRHCVKNLLGHTLFEYPGPRKKPIVNDIYIATLRGENVPRRVRTVMDLILETKKLSGQYPAAK